MLEIGLLNVREINSAWGKFYWLTHDCEPQLGRVLSCSGKLTSPSLDTFYSVGSVCTTTHVLKLTLSWYLMGRVTVRIGHFLFSLFLELRVIVFCFSCKYLWATIIFKCIYQKWIIGRSCKTKQKEEKKFKFLVKMSCIDFKFGP